MFSIVIDSMTGMFVTNHTVTAPTMDAAVRVARSLARKGGNHVAIYAPNGDRFTSEGLPFVARVKGQPVDATREGRKAVRRALDVTDAKLAAFIQQAEGGPGRGIGGRAEFGSATVEASGFSDSDLDTALEALGG